MHDKVPSQEDKQKRVIPPAPCRDDKMKLEAEEMNHLVCASRFCVLDLPTASFIINELHHYLVKKLALYNLKKTTRQ